MPPDASVREASHLFRPFPGFRGLQPPPPDGRPDGDPMDSGAEGSGGDSSSVGGGGSTAGEDGRYVAEFNSRYQAEVCAEAMEGLPAQ